MGDTLVLNPGSGGGTVAVDDIGGTLYPRGKVGWGADGAWNDVSLTAPLPVQGTVNVGGTVPVSGNIGGTVAISGTVPVSVQGTANVNVTGGTVSASVVGTVPVYLSNVGSVLINGNVEVVNDVGNPLPVSWTGQSVTVTSLPAISGTVSIAGTVPIQGSVNLSAVGTVTGTVSIAGTVPIQGSVNLSAVGTVTGTVSVSGTANVNITGGTANIAGTVPVTVSGSAAVVGNVDHDAADGGAPVKIGGWAGTADPGTVQHADRVNFLSDKAGKQVVMPYAIPENIISGTVTLTDTTAGNVIAAQAAGVKPYINSIIVANSGTVGVLVRICDGGTASIKMNIPAAASYGGAAIALPTPLPFSAAGTVVAQCLTAPSGGSIYVTCIGYKGA